MKTLLAALVVAGLTVACGGDGGSDTPAATTSTVTLSGVAAKGLLRDAVVSAYAVVNGVVGTTPVATTTTNANGEYTLPAFTATAGVPVIIRVTATTTTRAVDEVTGGLVALPSDFQLRSIYVPTTTGTVAVTSHVTPFSELATAAAARATGGVSPANAAQAQLNVTTLLGFDPTTIKPATIQTAQGPEQQALAVMLTAVSKLANDSGLGCTETALGDRTQCVVEKLSDSASLTSTKPGTVGGVDIAAKLVESAVAVVNDPTLTQGSTVDTSTIGTVKSGLEGAGTPPVVSTSPSITAAKNLFTGLKSDFSELFSAGGVTSIAQGAANIQAFKFKTAMDGVQVPLLALVADSGAVLSGIDLYNDFKAGRTTVNQRKGGSPDDVTGGNAQTMPNLAPVNCTLFDRPANDPAAVPAATPEQAVSIGCETVFYASRTLITNGVENTRWRHGFTITPGANNTYTYSTIARRTVQTCMQNTCTTTTNQALAEAGSTGTITTTLTGDHVSGFTIQGDLAGAFKLDTNELANARTTVNLTGSRTTPATKTSVSSFSGTAISKATDGSTLGTLTIASGSITEIPVSADANDNEVAPTAPNAVRPFGGTFGTASFDLTWANATAEFQGTMALTDSVWDKSLTKHAPSRGTFTGALRNIEGGVKTEFLSGSLTVATTGYGNYDAKLDDSATNAYTTAFTFVGAVTAPSRPKLELTINASSKSNEDEPATITMQLRSIVGGSPVRVVGAVATRSGDDYSVKLTEAASNLSMTWAPGATSATLFVNETTPVGQLSDATKVLTFTDGTFVSLDIGL